MTALVSSYPTASASSSTQLFGHANPTAPQSFLEFMHSPLDSWSLDNAFLQLPIESTWSGETSSIDLFGSGNVVVADAVESYEGGGAASSSPTVAPLWSTELPYLPPHNPPPSFPSTSSQLVTMPNTSNNKAHEPTSPKRSAADDEAFGSAAHSDKRARVSVEEVPDEEETATRCQTGADFNSDCGLFVPVAATSAPPTENASEVDTPPPPPRSPSPPRHLDTRPAVPSPLSPPAPPAPPRQRPVPTRRRSRANEIGLLKFALDPWLRLSRTLETSKHGFGGGCRPYNPATYPRAGNLRELRGWNRCGPFGNSVASAAATFTFSCDVGGLQFGEPDSVQWSLVDA